MIDKIAKSIIALINSDFDDPDITTEPKVVLGNLAFIDAFQDSSASSTTDKLIASIVNISQEQALRNIPFRKVSTNDEGVPIVLEKSPDIWLNVYILFGANRTEYDDALRDISKVIGFFQRKHVFSPTELQDALEESEIEDLSMVDKVIFDIYSMNFEELNHLWGILGGKYIPSVLYKVRLALIQEAEDRTQKPIQEIGASPNGI